MPARPRNHVVLVVLLAFTAVAWPIAQGAKPAAGAATPQEAVAAVNKATAANNMLLALPVISPRGLKQLANEGITGVLMVLAFSDPDDGMPGGPKPSKGELDAKRKNYKEAVGLATQFLKPHGLDTLLGKPVLAPEVQKSIDAAIDKADSAAMITTLFNTLVKINRSDSIQLG